MNELVMAIAFAFGATALSGIRIVNQGNEALVENLGKYQGKKLEPGLNYLIPVMERVVCQQTVRERVIDVPPQQCVTRDNVMITADAVVYWRIVDLEKSYYKVENLQSAMTNLVLTQIRSEMGKLELDETFTARERVNEVLLRDLDVATDPWGVKVTRVELRDIIPSKAVQESMELQMSAERQKRAAILTSEGQRESAVNAAQGKAEAQVLAAESEKKAAILDAEAHQQAIVLEAQANQKQQVLQAQAIAQAVKIVGQSLEEDPQSAEALQFLMAQQYLTTSATIGTSDSSKVMFMDPQSILATLESAKALTGDMKSKIPTNGNVG
ncbi:MAG: SPFH domain-containing protein [Cyanobacteria bacterium P01_C01_bin.89]